MWYEWWCESHHQWFSYLQQKISDGCFGWKGTNAEAKIHSVHLFEKERTGTYVVEDIIVFLRKNIYLSTLSLLTKTNVFIWNYFSAFCL